MTVDDYPLSFSVEVISVNILLSDMFPPYVQWKSGNPCFQ
jgi:hypothetical protein